MAKNVNLFNLSHDNKTSGSKSTHFVQLLSFFRVASTKSSPCCFVTFIEYFDMKVQNDHHHNSGFLIYPSRQKRWLQTKEVTFYSRYHDLWTVVLAAATATLLYQCGDEYISSIMTFFSSIFRTKLGRKGIKGQVMISRHFAKCK